MAVIPIKILLVEDNPADVKLTRLAFNSLNVANEIQTVKDGVEALAYLRREGPYSNVNRPDLILLDLNLPKLGGREVLMNLKNDIELKTIPIVILTTSNDASDILETYRHHANCYITKPVDLEGFLTTVKSIESFWFTVAQLPKCPS